MSDEDRPRGVSADAVARVLEGLGFTDAVMIPDGESRELHTALRDSHLNVWEPTREGEGVAIAAGLWVGGRRPVVALQNTGMLEAGDAIRGCGLGPAIPLVLLIGWRGYAGAARGALPVDSAYTYTLPTLDAWEIPHRTLMADDDLGVISEMADLASSTSRPCAVVYGFPFRP